MSNLVLDKILDSLIHDPRFRESFQTDRATVIAPMGLSPKERDLLSQLDIGALVEGGTSAKHKLLRGAHF